MEGAHLTAPVSATSPTNADPAGGATLALRAPFAGRVIERKVAPGALFEALEPLLTLADLSTLWVFMQAYEKDLALLREGVAVTIRSEAYPQEALKGKVDFLGSVVDPATRSVKVRASVRNPGEKLRPGMFVTAIAGLGSATSVIPIPASAINYAPYGDSVFIVEDMKDPKGKAYKGVRQQFVKLGPGRGDQVAIVEGLKPGEEIVSSGVFKLRQGAAVEVNNKTQPANSSAPKPEDS
jgi:membrane fusion protein (multidrug efflux system)